VTAVETAPAKGAREDLKGTAKTMIGGLLIALVLRVLLFQPYTIPSSSMEPGLRTGDYVIVSKYSYGWSRASLPFDPPLPGGRLLGRSPQRGDVIVFRLPRDPQQVYVKRLIGLPGDRVQVRGGQVHVNGAAIPQQPAGFTEDPEAPGRRVLQVLEPRADGKQYVTYDGGPGEGDDTGGARRSGNQALARALWKRMAPSAEPSSGSKARSGWGIRPSTLPRALTMPAMSRAEPLGLFT
jgi:signal peptidase I